jgi:hypothetical protein
MGVVTGVDSVTARSRFTGRNNASATTAPCCYSPHDGAARALRLASNNLQFLAAFTPPTATLPFEGLLLSLPSGEELIRLDVVRVMEHHAAEHHLGMYFEYIH